MELTGDKWKKYSTKSIDENNIKPRDKYWEEEKLETLSVGELIEQVEWLKSNIELNHKNPYDIPVFINNKSDEDYNSRYCFSNVCLTGLDYCTLGYSEDDKLIYTPADSRPENGGEYWASRGPGYPDVSGFVKSKLAGERLQRLVNYVLDNDNPKTHLDYRPYEPSWIQFKFHQDEFDIEKLDKLSRENDGVITEEILRKCVK